MEGKRILITGASGLLGRALMRRCASEEGLELLGTALSRATPPLLRLDLLSEKALVEVLDSFSPSVIVHAAAERRPDKVERDSGSAFSLNVLATGELAFHAAVRGIKLVYISTDYVFDGVDPPFFPDSAPNPLNLYGRMKLAGERAVIDSGAAYSVLRIPMLYGPSLELAESPVTETLLKLIPSADSVFPVHVDDWAMRYPAHVDDVARAVSFIWDRRKGGIFHFAGVEAMTKYRMTLRMASLAGLDSRAILPDPLPSGTVPRPKDCRLDGSSLEALGFTPQIRFETGIRELLTGFFPLLSERELPAGA